MKLFNFLLGLIRRRTHCLKVSELREAVHKLELEGTSITKADVLVALMGGEPLALSEDVSLNGSLHSPYVDPVFGCKASPEEYFSLLLLVKNPQRLHSGGPALAEALSMYRFWTDVKDYCRPGGRYVLRVRQGCYHVFKTANVQSDPKRLALEESIIYCDGLIREGEQYLTKEAFNYRRHERQVPLSEFTDGDKAALQNTPLKSIPGFLEEVVERE